MKKIILFLLISILSLSLFSINNQEELKLKASEAYKNNDFDQALSMYSDLETQIGQNPDILYNIGNCYFRLNRIGLAILYYKKALLINSSHQLAQKNLNFALKFTIDKQDFDNQNFLSNIISKVYHSLSINLLSWISLLVLILLVAVIHRLLRGNNEYAHTIQLIFIVLIFINLLFISWTSIRFYHYKNNNTAVILSSVVSAYSGPGEKYTKLFTIHEGLVVKINKQDNAWSLLSLDNGLSGWVRSSTYKMVANE